MPPKQPKAKGRMAALKDAKRRIERHLHRHVTLRHQHGPLRYTRHVDAELRNVVGVAIAASRARGGTTHAESAPPGEPVLLVLLNQPRSHSKVRKLLRRL